MWSKSPDSPSSPSSGDGASPSQPSNTSHFNPIGDFLQAFQSAIAKWGSSSMSAAASSKDSPKMKLRRAATVNDMDTLRFEHIELTQFSRVELDPTQRGIGHSFVDAEMLTPDWCDYCGDFIWGLYKSEDNLVCQHCNYTCHQQCSGMVTLNCKTHAAETAGEDEGSFEMKFEEPAHLYSEETLRGENLKNKIATFNSLSEDYHIEIQDDCETFHGFIRVHMNLSRPINVLAGTRPPSIYDIIYDEEEYTEKTLTSFYLPRDTVKAIHVTSNTTAQQLISALLKKFKVVDNPRKFRLYEKSWIGDGTMKGVLRRIQDHEKPLWLVMSWEDGIDRNHKLVLQENEIGDILWDAFTFPELNNFLRILDREEDEYINQVHKKYKSLQEKMQEAMDRLKPTALPEPADEPFTDM